MNIGIGGDRARVRNALSAAGSALLVALALVACGGGDSGGAPGAPGPAGVAASSTSGRALMRAAAAALASADNVLAADGFEAGMGNWSNWGNAQVVDGAGTGGSRAMRVGTGAGGAGLMAGGIVPGETYQLTAQVRADPSETFYLGINIMDAAGQRVAQQAVPVTSTGYGLGTIEVDAPAGASSAVIFVWKDAGSGYGYIDDVQLARATSSPPPPSDNLLSNPGFEGGMASWVDWGNTLVVDGAGVSASRALRVGTAAGGAGQVVDGIVAGAQYRLTARVKVTDPSEIAYVGVNILDASGSNVAQQAVAFSSTTSTTATVQVAAPAAGVRAQVFVWKNAGNGYGYVDDLVFTRSDATQPPAPDNLVLNPGFEEALYGSWLAVSEVEVTSDAAAGARAVKLGNGSGGWGSGGWVQQWVQTVPGQNYTIGAQAKVSDASEPVSVGICFFDSQERVLSGAEIPFGQLAYQSGRFDVVAPANGVAAIVYAWKGDGIGLGYADSISVAANPAGSAGSGVSASCNQRVFW